MFSSPQNVLLSRFLRQDTATIRSLDNSWKGSRGVARNVTYKMLAVSTNKADYGCTFSTPRFISGVNMDHFTALHETMKVTHTLQIEFTLFAAMSIRPWMYTWHSIGTSWELWRDEYHLIPKHHRSQPRGKDTHTHPLPYMNRAYEREA